ncbi:hypothetical protein GCM10020254_17050 [Streptomyces goshikiensis]
MVEPLGVGGQPDPVAFGEPGREGAYDVAAADPDGAGQLLGGEVGVVQVVLAAVEELPDLLVR